MRSGGVSGCVWSAKKLTMGDSAMSFFNHRSTPMDADACALGFLGVIGFGQADAGGELEN